MGNDRAYLYHTTTISLRSTLYITALRETLLSAGFTEYARFERGNVCKYVSSSSNFIGKGTNTHTRCCYLELRCVHYDTH